MKKRILSVLLSAAMSMTLLPHLGMAAFAAEDKVCAESGCDGTYVNGFCTKDETHYQAAQQVSESHHPELNKTHNGYYAIENAGQLYWFAKKVDDKDIGELTSQGKDTLVNVNVVLTDDITDNTGVLNENGKLNTGKIFRTYNPIGKSEYADGGGTQTVYFNGAFDGNGKTIKGLYHKAKTSSMTYGMEDKYISLIATASKNTVVKNVTVKDSYFCGYDSVGGIVANLNNGKIMNCTSYAMVTGNQKIGGITGYMGNSASAVDCVNYGYVSGCNMLGGFVGQTNDSYSNLSIERCANFGDVHKDWSRSNQVGGFVGYMSGGKLTNCFNVGKLTVEGASSYVGGFVGYFVKGTTKNCYTTGGVSSTASGDDANKIGGFTGMLNASNTECIAENCYFNSENVTQNNDKITESTGNNKEVSETQIAAVTTADLKSGRVAYLLNGNQSNIVFKQTLKKDEYPVFSGLRVYHSTESGEYYNLEYKISGVSGGNVTVTAPEAKSCKLIFADYEGKALKNVSVTDVTTVEGEKRIAVPSNVSLGSGDKIMLWSGIDGIIPLCDAYVVQ